MAASDVVITTAQIPGRKAPVLVTAAMVDGMAEGSVIVDMAADSGGNCELSVAGEDVVVDGVTVVGLANPPAAMPTHASFLYARNIANFLALLVRDGELAPDFDDEIVAGTCVVRAGSVVHGPTAEALGLPAGAAPPDRHRPSEPGTGRHREETGHEHRDRRVRHRLRPGRVRRERGDRPGPEHPAHPAHVGQQRHPRHRPGRDHPRSWARPTAPSRSPWPSWP